MSPPCSEFFAIQTISNAGRGVVASQKIPAFTIILESDEPVAHVVFRAYRKEVCAQCFDYDRGRTLPVRDNDTGKVFCSLRCQSRWTDREGDLAIAAWRSLHALIQSQSKRLADSAELPVDGTKPDVVAIDAAWSAVTQQVDKGVIRQNLRPPKPNAVKSTAKVRRVDPDLLSFFLSGVVSHMQHPETWQRDVLCLAAEEQPYKSHEELTAHCDSFAHLAALLPQELYSNATAEVCRALAQVGSHNAFGLRSGSADGEEYMGYCVYTSASYFNHSCTPNVRKRRIGRCWEFAAARDIDAGEQCCITYLGGDEKDLNVWQRRIRLKEVWDFECKCERCERCVCESTSGGIDHTDVTVVEAPPAFPTVPHAP